MGLRASEEYIQRVFLFEQHANSLLHPDLERINDICQQFCESGSLYTSHVLNRRMFITQNGLLGLGPRGLAKDDVVCILYGCGVPLVLRPTRGGHYRLVGEAYVHSIMDGQALDDQEHHTQVTVTIV